MSTCDTCKHWKTGDQFGFTGDAMITCHRSGYGLCAQPNDHAADRAPMDGIHIDSGDYAASNGHLETGPKFGCIHHEAARKRGGEK